MQIFEFHFNPRKKNRIVDTFCYEPEKLKAKQSGHLYMTGELLNILPGSNHFLNNLSKIIKEEYYSEFYSSFDNSIRKSLSRANDYLSIQISKNNVSWLGNINFAIVSLYGQNIISVAKIGNVKVLMIKNEQIIDITKKVNSVSYSSQEFSYSPKAFGRLFSGKITQGDKIIVLTKEVFDLFEKLSILDEISAISCIGKENLEKIIDSKKNELLKISGAFLLIETLEEKKKKEFENISEEQEFNFSFKNVFLPFKNALFPFKNKIYTILSQKIKKINLFKKIEKKNDKNNKKNNKKKLKFILKDKIKIKNLDFFSKQNTKKILFLILLLIFLLTLGSFIFNNKKNHSEKIEIDMISINQEIQKAEDLINRNQEGEAFITLKDLYKKVDSTDDFLEIKNEIEFRLSKLSNLEKIENPELIYEFKDRDLAPRKVFVFNEKIYFFTPFSNKIVELNIETRESKEYFLPVERGKGPSSARIISNNPIFFMKPNKLFIFRNNEIETLSSLKEPELDYNFSHFSVFWNSLYFWDSEIKEIIRYTGYNSNPEKWMHNDTKKPTDIQSMSVDGLIWILGKDGSISKYSDGILNQEIFLSIFPFLEKPSHIYTSSSLYHVFILEPFKNRIIIIDKQGNVIKQFQSDKFNNLVHFSISENGNQIYLLNNLQAYRINIR